ncbi:MAG: tetratricopeptide (TPR) repeat protein, partial [Planctomycetota bacterium]
ESATELAYHGLHREALIEFTVAEELADTDTAKRCKVMSEMGRLQERLQEIEEALATYDRAIGLMSRGNWLKRDLMNRVVAIHRRTGTLEEMVASARAAASEHARDLDAVEFLATSLEEVQRFDEAAEVLAGATADFPSDLSLSRHRIEVLKRTEDTDGVIAEYQRILAEQPEELDLYMDLGRVLASEGRFDAAKRQWNRTLEKRLTDPGLCIRLATFYALYDQIDDAVGMYEKAIALEPSELRHYGDLSSLLTVRGRLDDVPAVLERAASAAAGSAPRLEELAGLWAQFGDHGRAREAVEAALELDAGNPKLLGRLADLLIREGNVERASDVLHQVVNNAKEAGLRTSAVDRLVRLYRQSDRLEELALREQADVDAGSTERAPYLVLAKMYVSRRDPDQAIRLYERLLEIDADQEDPRRALARLYEERGDQQLALDQYAALIERQPQARRRYLKEVAKIHLNLLNQDEAFACYDEILGSAPDNPAAFKEVADAYKRLGLWDKVIECMQQAVRLKPDDGRLRMDLADAYRQRGEWDKAREHVLEAVASREESVEKRARKGYYLLLSEGGRLDREIESLRARVEENPYDLEAPLALTDIYQRELEYELAIEILDGLIILQPREAALLRQRAKLYVLMERFGEAITDFETLWKLPKADHQTLSTDIAAACLESGDLERAKQLMAGVHDLRKVARLYKKHDLPEEAVKVLEKGVAGGAGVGRMMLQLAQIQEDIGDRGSAAGTLERMLALQGDSWKVLIRLGDLYHELGRKPESLDIGHRLFSMVRVDEPDENEPDKEDEEEDENKSPWSSSYRSYWQQAGNQRYGERLGQIKQYFETKGYIREFLDLAVAESKLQPSNAQLLTGIWWVFNQVEDSQPLAYELLEGMRAAVDKSGRIPPGYTQDTWIALLASREHSLYREDSRFAGTQLTAVDKRLADPAGGTTDDHMRKAKLLEALQKDAERRAALEAGLVEHPESIGLLAALGRVQQLDKDYSAAAETFQKLIPLLVTAKVREAELKELEISFKRRKNSLLQGFAVHMQRRVGDESLRRLFFLSTSFSTSQSWGPGVRPTLDGARQGLATCLFKLGRDEEARAAMATLEPENPEHITRWAILANIYYTEEQFEPAEALYRRVLAIEADLEADPILGFNRSWSSPVARAVQNLARILEKRGDLEEACDLFLNYGARNQAELLLTTSEGFESAAERYREQMDAIVAELPSKENIASGDPEDPRLREWRNLGIMLANVRQFQKRWDDVLSIYQELSERDANDFTLAENLAALHQRDKNLDAAIAVHRDIIERKRIANRQMERPKRPPGRRLAPTRPPGVASEDYNITRLGRGGYGRAPGLKSVSVNYAAILKLYLDDNRATEAVGLLRQMAREDASSFRYMGSTIRSLISKYQLGTDAVPLLRLLHSYSQNDHQTGMEYGKALVKALSYDEAHKVFTDLLNKNRNYAYYRDQATRELDSLEARMGMDQKVTLDDLRSNVETDPKNVRTRMKLAKRLMKDRLFEEALAEMRAAEELAPFRDEVKAEIIKCLTVLGRDDELVVALTERRARLKSSDDEKFGITVRLANWALDRGDREAADALFEDAFDVQSGGWVNAAPSSWYIQKGFYDVARKLLEEEIEAMGGGQWNGLEAKQRLEAMYLLEGDPSKAFDQAWKRFEKANGRGGKLVFFKQLPQVIRRLPDPQGSREQVFASAEKHGGLRGGLYRAAWYLAVADLTGAEAELARIVAAEEEGDFLYVALLELALERNDVEAALAYLDQLQGAVSLSRSRRVSTPLGSVDERKAELMSRGSLLLELGREDEAWAIFDGLFEEEEKEDMRNIMPGLNARFDHYEQAASIVQERLDEEGEQNYRLLTQLAGYLRQLDRPDEAIELLGRALILSGRNASVRTTLMAAHRENGSLDTYFDELKGEADEDPEDEPLQRALLNLAMELGRNDVALESARRISERADDAASMKQFLMLQRGASGELDRARELQVELLEAGDGNAKKRAARNMAWKHVRDEDLAAAVELITKAYSDVDPLQLQQQLATLYRQAKDYEELLLCADAMLKLAPKDIASHSTRLEALGKLERWEAAIDGVHVVLDENKFESSWASYVIRLGYLSSNFDEVARQEAALALDPTDADAQRRLAWVLAARHEDAPAISALSAVLAEDPEQRLALRLLWPFQRKLQLYNEAQATIESLLVVLDREQAVQANSWTLSNEISQLRHAIGILYFLRDEWSTGLEEWKKPRGSRYGAIQTYSYSYYNSPIQTGDTHQKLAHGLYDDYISARRMDAWFDSWSSQWNREQTVEARFRKGERAAALEDLWNIVAEPGRSLISGSGNSFFVFSAFDDSRVNSEWRVLVRLWQEEGRMDELVARVDTRLKARPDDTTMQGIRSYIRRIQEDWEPLLVLAEEALADKPDDKTMLTKLAGTYVELERYADAVPHYERLLRLARGKVQANSG